MRLPVIGPVAGGVGFPLGDCSAAPRPPRLKSQGGVGAGSCHKPAFCSLAAIVAFGADAAPTHFGYSIEQIYVADPARGIFSWEAGQFHQLISEHWIIHSYK